MWSARKTDTHMTTGSPVPQTALKYETEVRDQGVVEIHVPLVPGQRVVVFVIPEPPDTIPDLVAASTSSLDFWDNPLDDEDWNNT
jgi:hypothetical protein